MLKIISFAAFLSAILIFNPAQTVYGRSAEDFALTIVIEETTLPQGERFLVNVELKNISGERVDIVHEVFWILPYVPNMDFLGGEDFPRQLNGIILGAGDVIQRSQYFGRDLPPGTHELRYVAAFYADWRRVEVLSNAIMLTVTGSAKETTVQASDEITVTINGVPVIFPDQRPIIVDGRTLVPVRGVFEELGFRVRWYRDLQLVTLSRGDDMIMLYIGSDIFTANGESHRLEVPAQSIGGRAMLPIREVVESVGYSVYRNRAERTVEITTERPPFDLQGLLGRNFDGTRRYFGNPTDRFIFSHNYVYKRWFDTGMLVYVNDTDDGHGVVVRIRVSEPDEGAADSHLHFAGIQVGISTRSDVLAALGEPHGFADYRGDGHGGGLSYVYRSVGGYDAWFFFDGDYNVTGIVYQMPRNIYYNLSTVTLFYNSFGHRTYAARLRNSVERGQSDWFIENHVVNNPAAIEGMRAAVEQFGLQGVLTALERNGVTLADIGMTISDGQIILIGN